VRNHEWSDVHEVVVEAASGLFASVAVLPDTLNL